MSSPNVVAQASYRTEPVSSDVSRALLAGFFTGALRHSTGLFVAGVLRVNGALLRHLQPGQVGDVLAVPRGDDGAAGVGEREGALLRGRLEAAPHRSF